MDINFLRTLLTLAAFGAFLGIVWWAYAPSRKSRFEADSRIVFDETPALPAANSDKGAR